MTSPGRTVCVPRCVLATGPAVAAASLISATAAGGPSLVQAIYTASDGQPVAGSFLPLAGSVGRITGWVGVEAPLSIFIGDTHTDQVTMLLIVVLAILVTFIVVTLFVSRVIWRPLSRLERGVARIADGDYESAIETTSRGELGRLAISVNRMRERINEQVTEIAASRRRLDSSVERMSQVSRALTATAAGVSKLDGEVLAAAAGLGGSGCSAWLALRQDQLLEFAAVRDDGGPEVTPPDSTAVSRLLSGHTVVRPAATDAEVSILAVPMFLQGQVVGALGVVAPHGVDLSPDQDVLAVLANNAAIARENARLFDQERATVHRLRELDHMKTDFLSTVQHELRTPLTAILGLSDLIEMCWGMWEDAAKLEAVRDIQVAAKNLYDIVETIIDFSALEGENLGLSPEPVTLRPAIELAVGSVAERYKGGIAIPLDIEVDPELTIYGDRDRIDQVLRALIDNAVKFSDGVGGVSIMARRTRRRVRIEVHDRGIGIPEAEVARVFDRFYQVDNTATRRFGGTGMGLALVQRLVQAHGATAEVRSRVGEGTTVIVEWPAVPAASGGEARRVAEERGEITGQRPQHREAPVPVQ